MLTADLPHEEKLIATLPLVNLTDRIHNHSVRNTDPRNSWRFQLAHSCASLVWKPVKCFLYVLAH